MVEFARLKKSTRSKRIPLPPLAQGQRWELDDSHIQISIVGKRLVHYRHFKGQVKRATLSIASIPVLENYLSENKAVLAAQAAVRTAA